MRILIADDHDLVRDGIRSRLSLSGCVEICAEASDGKGAVRAALEHEPDIILLDISMPDMNGLEAARSILAANPAARIMFLSIYDNPEYIREAMRIGVKGYLLKDVSREEMLTAIDTVHRGGTYLGSKVIVSLTGEQGRSSTEPDYNLTVREKEILRHVAAGLSNREIAVLLSISVRTVESHRLSLREKTGGGNAARLYNIALELGLVDQESPSRIVD